MAQEGAAHFFLGHHTKNFVISCWDRVQWKAKKLSPNENSQKSHFGFRIAHF